MLNFAQTLVNKSISWFLFSWLTINKIVLNPLGKLVIKGAYVFWLISTISNWFDVFLLKSSNLELYKSSSYIVVFRLESLLNDFDGDWLCVSLKLWFLEFDCLVLFGVWLLLEKIKIWN